MDDLKITTRHDGWLAPTPVLFYVDEETLIKIIDSTSFCWNSLMKIINEQLHYDLYATKVYFLPPSIKHYKDLIWFDSEQKINEELAKLGIQ